MRRAALLSLVLLAVLASPAAAQNKLFQDYKKDGYINPCDYSRGELRGGLKGLPPDIEQYAPGFGDQLRRGANCGGPGGGSAPAGGEQQSEEQPSAAAPGGGGGPPSGSVAVADPPEPSSPARASVTGAAPGVPAAAGSAVPEWLVVLLAALGAGALAVALLTRYGLIDPAGAWRPLRASLAGAVERLRPGL